MSLDSPPDEQPDSDQDDRCDEESLRSIGATSGSSSVNDADRETFPAAGRVLLNQQLLARFKHLHVMLRQEDDASKRSALVESMLAVPFPVFTFGTLSVLQSNNAMMGLPDDMCALDGTVIERDHAAQGTEDRRRMSYVEHLPRYAFWSPASVQDTERDGLTLVFRPTERTMGEVFWYSAANFRTMICPVDRLESFSCHAPNRSFYQRSLMLCTEVPWQKYPAIRNLRPKNGRYPPTLTSPVAAWVYSSRITNGMLTSTGSPTLMWEPGTPDRLNFPMADAAAAHNDA